MSEPFLGNITLFCGNFAPYGWAFCNGQLMSIAQNTALFSILGAQYGGDGKVTFALPDFRGRVPIHQGLGTYLTLFTIGEQGGEESLSLNSTEIPAHTHTVAASSQAGTQPSPVNTIVAASVDNNAGGNPTNFVAPTSAITNFASNMINVAGSSQPHSNMQPTVALNFIIALEGIFPQRQ